MSGDVWYPVGPHDVFPEEFATFLLTDPRTRESFTYSPRGPADGGLVAGHAARNPHRAPGRGALVPGGASVSPTPGSRAARPLTRTARGGPRYTHLLITNSPVRRVGMTDPRVHSRSPAIAPILRRNEFARRDRPKRLRLGGSGMFVSAFDLYRIGPGPSSTHTVGPMRAAQRFVHDLEADGLLLADALAARRSLRIGRVHGRASSARTARSSADSAAQLPETVEASDLAGLRRARGRRAGARRSRAAIASRSIPRPTSTFTSTRRSTTTATRSGSARATAPARRSRRRCITRSATAQIVADGEAPGARSAHARAVHVRDRRRTPRARAGQGQADRRADAHQ